MSSRLESVSVVIMLTELQVVEIYMRKLSIADEFTSHCQTVNQRLRGASPPIAVRFGVSSRTIRDIWNRKTWAFVTKHLWHLESHYEDAHMQVKICSCVYFLDFLLVICSGSSMLPTAWSTERL